MRSVVRVTYAAVAAGSLIGAVLLGVAAARTAAERQESGARGYQEFCAMCHGNEGLDDGDAAATLKKDSSVAIARLNVAGRLSVLGRAGVRKVLVNLGTHTGRSNLMPAWGSKLSATLVDDITDYVVAMPTRKPGVPTPAPAGTPAAGRELYIHNCSACHGPYGQGDGSLAQALRQKKIRPRNLTDSTTLAARTDPQLSATISLGGGHVGKPPSMPAWAVYLTPAQIKDLVSYIRWISHTASQP